MEKKNHQEKKVLTSKQEWFRRQLPEHRWSIIKPFLDLHNSAISNRMAILPLLATLSVAMLVVATLNPGFITLNIIAARIILSVFLILIPVSLFFYILDLEKAEEKIRGIIKEYIGKNLLDNLEITFRDKFIVNLPKTVTIIYFIIVIYLLYVIWF